MFNIFDKITGLFKKNAYGIYISDKQIQVIEVNKKSKEITSISQKELPQGVVNNGEIVEEKALGEAIKSLMKEAKPRPIKTSKIFVSIPEDQVYEHVFFLPSTLSGTEFEKEIQKQIEERIPLPFYEIKYDYFVTPHGNVKVTFVTMVKKEIIAQYYQTLKDFVGIVPVCLEPESISLIRNINYDFSKDEGTVLIEIEGKELNYWVLWNSNIFDSNTLTLEDENTYSQFLIELPKSLLNLENHTGRKVTNVLISGTNSTVENLKSEIENNLKLPVQLAEYKLLPTGVENPENYKTICGLSQKGLSENIKTQINLLKKNGS